MAHVAATSWVQRRTSIRAARDGGDGERDATVRGERQCAAGSASQSSLAAIDTQLIWPFFRPATVP